MLANENIVIGIVAVVAVLGLFVMMGGVPSNDLTGQAIGDECRSDNDCSSSEVCTKAGCQAVPLLECEDGEDCLPASSATCTDSDAGLDYYLQGTVTDASGSVTDYCHPNVASIVIEHTCADLGGEKYDCANDGMTCVDGECVLPPPCVDTEIGIDPAVQGTVTLSNGETYTDYCNTGVHLSDYYCDGGSLVSQTVFCAVSGMVCNNGVCEYECTVDSDCASGQFCNTVNECEFTIPCTDSDASAGVSGHNPYVQGTATLADGSTFTDSCSRSGNLLQENYCEGGNSAHYTVFCSNIGLVCSNGACV
jgi:hypothetical protein